MNRLQNMAFVVVVAGIWSRKVQARALSNGTKDNKGIFGGKVLSLERTRTLALSYSYSYSHTYPTAPYLPLPHTLSL